MIETDTLDIKRIEQKELPEKQKLYPVNFEFFTYFGALPVFNYGSVELVEAEEDKAEGNLFDVNMEATSVTEIIIEE